MPMRKRFLKKQEMLEKAHSVLILFLADNVLREVSRETTTAGIWSRLGSLYMTKSLANRLYMKSVEEKSIGEQLEEFNKSVDDLENIDVKLEDEDKAIILLSALPKSFDHSRDAMLYGREKIITLEEVQCALKSKELRKASSNQDSSSSQALNVKGQNKGKKKKSFQNQKPHQKQTDGSGIVILGHNQVCYVKGISTIRLKMQDGCIRVLTEVRCIPQVKRNMISLGLLERKGCVFSFAGGKMMVTKISKVVMEAERRGSIYYLLSAVQIAAKAESDHQGGALAGWKSGLQHVVALSTTKAEYIAITEAVKEAKWLKGILEDFGERQETVDIFCDNSSALSLAKHQVFHERSKHIDVRMHFLRDEVQKGEIRMVKVSTDHCLTKPLPAMKFRYCLKLVGLQE